MDGRWNGGNARRKIRFALQCDQSPTERVSGVGDVGAWGPHSKKVLLISARDSLMRHKLNQYQILSIRTESFQMPNGRLIDKGRMI